VPGEFNTAYQHEIRMRTLNLRTMTWELYVATGV